MDRRELQRLLNLLVAMISIASLIALALWIRWPITKTDAFSNEDVAGITYNADLLRQGLLPMVDSVEMKAPGSFFITWAAWSIWGRSLNVLECLGVAWSILAALGIFFTARALFGPRSALIAGLLYVIYSPISDDMTVNYNAWMICAYIWSTFFFVVALKRGKLGYFVGCGLMLTVAGLCKRQGAVLFPLYAALIWFSSMLGAPTTWARFDRRHAMLAFFFGLAIGFVPIFSFYLAKGHAREFVMNYFFSQSGWRYVGGELSLGDKISRLEDAFTGFWQFMLLPTLLASMTLVASVGRPRRGDRLVLSLLAGMFVLSFLGLSLGFRFYRGYYIQALPALVLLSVHPEGPLFRWFAPGLWPRNGSRLFLRLAKVGAMCFFVFLAARPGYAMLKKERDKRGNVNHVRREATRLSEIIAKNTTKQDRIWVWGRWAWPIYFHADRLSPTRYYKVIDVITTNLTNTWRRRTMMTRFVPHGPEIGIARELTDTKPAYIITAVNEDHKGWTGFEDLLAKEYEEQTIAGITAFHLYQRKGLVKKPPPTPKLRPRPRGPSDWFGHRLAWKNVVPLMNQSAGWLHGWFGLR